MTSFMIGIEKAKREFQNYINENIYSPYIAALLIILANTI